MGVFDEHLGKVDGIVDIEGKEFVLKQLGTDDMSDYFMAMKAFSGAKEGASATEIIQGLDKEGLQYLSKLIDKVLEMSYPEEAEEKRKKFGLKYMPILMTKIFEMNSQQVSTSTDGRESVKSKIIQRMKQVQDAKKLTEDKTESS